MNRYAKSMRKLALLLACALFGLAGTYTARATSVGSSKHVNGDAASGVYYEIFPRSWYDTNNDGIGDLNGVIAKLDYLKSLGVSGIWLTPINPSPTYHGYDITDYFAINPQLGTMADFERLLHEAHKRGIKVLMDLVLNHTSDLNPWFRKAIDPKSPYHDWYVWAGKDTDLQQRSALGGQAWHAINGEHYLGIFTEQMPDLNYDNPVVRKEAIRIGQFWLNKGVDGFRLDAARHIYEDFASEAHQPAEVAKNVAWWKQFRTAMRQVNPQVFLVGEVSADTEAQLAPYYAGLNSVFNFPAAKGLIMSADQQRSIDIGTQASQAYALFRKSAGGPATDTPFLSNHDQNRVLDQLGGNLAHMRMAAAMLMTLKGYPFVYYGEEIGMRGSKPDPDIREPMRWDPSASTPGETRWEEPSHNRDPQVSVSAEDPNPESLLNFYRTIIHWRSELPALRDGDMAHYSADGGPISAYVRRDAKQSLLIVHNLSADTHEVTLTDFDGHHFTRIICQTRPDAQIRSGELRIPAYTSVILE